MTFYLIAHLLASSLGFSQNDVEETVDLVNAIAVSPDKNIVYFGGWDGSIHEWNLRTKKLTRWKWEPTERRLLTFALSPDYSRLAVGETRGQISIWDTRKRELLKSFKGHTAWVTAVLLSTNDLLISGSTDGTIKQWNLSTHGKMKTLLAGNTGVNCIAGESGKRIVASGDDDGNIILWMMADAPAITIRAHRRFVSCLVLSEPIGKLFSGAGDGTIKTWDLQSKQELKMLVGHKGTVLSLAFSKKKGVLASGGVDKTVRIWDIETGKARYVLNHLGAVASLAFLPDQQTLVVGTNRNTVCFWNVETGKKLDELRLVK